MRTHLLTRVMSSARKHRNRGSRPHLDVSYAVADPTRRALPHLLSEGEEPVDSLAEHFAISRPAISQHLAILLKTDLVRSRRVGRQRRYRLQPMPLAQVYDSEAHDEAFWTGKRYIQTLLNKCGAR